MTYNTFKGTILCLLFPSNSLMTEKLIFYFLRTKFMCSWLHHFRIDLIIVRFICRMFDFVRGNVILAFLLQCLQDFLKIYFNTWKKFLKIKFSKFKEFSCLITSRTLKLNFNKTASLPDSSHSLTQSCSTRAFIALWTFSLTLYSKAWHELKLRKPQFHTNTVSISFICVCVTCKNAFRVLFISRKTISHENNGKSGAFLLEITNIIIKSLKSFYHQLELSEIKKVFCCLSFQFVQTKKNIKFSGCSFYF
jgi:hypothetical protein